jgi:hypothetical protein
VLLHCGDHDPGGVHISDFLRSNLADVSVAAANWENRNNPDIDYLSLREPWDPNAANLDIDRFGLNYDFIRAQRLTWIDNLETGSGGNLADERHPDHEKPYVQNYLNEFGARKVEANALVVRPCYR